ncbi:RNA 3'-terminal phosphate cyclase/enolpyruvate transferase [Lentinula raphanica]|nr:RNA 3'-terminal phosphate cyclase/enolpyruvate transferase [Lentinula raphanica]
MLAPFAKRPVQLTLCGITTDGNDPSTDPIRIVTLPHLQLFEILDGLELRINKRGAPPGGGGEVQFLSPIVTQVKMLNFVEPGKIKRIRGTSHTARVNPQFSDREESGKSPGYALSLLAVFTTFALFCSEVTLEPGVAPEDIALQAIRALLSEISEGE